MNASDRYASSHSNTHVPNWESCRLIEAVYSAGLREFAAMNGLPALSLSSVGKCGSSQSSFCNETASSSTEYSSVGNFSSTPADIAFDSAYHQFSQTSHMGILDPSYKLFTSTCGNGSLLYKVRNGVVVVAGDPLCETRQIQALLDEFQLFRGTRKMKLIHVGASKQFAQYSRGRGCITMQFGQERVLNPVTNPVLHGKSGKRIRSQCRQLLDPGRGNVTVGLYCPSIDGADPVFESNIQGIYDTWRQSRDENPGASAAFITQYQLFSRPEITLFLYAKNSDGTIVGVAGLRCLGANRGFQLDPCVATEKAPRGVTDLLVILAMQLLRSAGISYLSMGFEPFEEVQDLAGQRGVLAKLTKGGYRTVMQSVHAAGKKAYYDRFHPDDLLSSDLFIVLPRGKFHLQEYAALMRTANINIGNILWNKGKAPGSQTASRADMCAS